MKKCDVIALRDKQSRMEIAYSVDHKYVKYE